jgi:hypothetical protein
MFELKTISREGIPKALDKARRYRLLNEPRGAESIYRDILIADPDHEVAVIGLILALTDQFGRGLRVHVGHAEELLPRIKDEYACCYYAGVICERWGKSLDGGDSPGYVVYDWLVKAMSWYEKAEALAPDDSQDPVLRWNACVRIMKRNPSIRPRPEDQKIDEIHQDDVPVQ